MRRTLYSVLVVTLSLSGIVTTARAQDPDNSEHGVARISIIAGDVTVQRGDSGEETAAAVNAPLMAGDVVSTAPGARAEIQFDSANLVRLASDSQLRISELTGQRDQLQVARGTVVFSVVRDSRSQVEINTPSVSVRPTQRGAYRITVFDDGRAEITPRAGEAEVYGPRGVETLRAGSTMEVRGDPSDPEFQVAGAVAQDDFDRWNAERDQNLMRSHSYQHVNPEIYGADDLDGHGRWVNSPEYGEVWAPNVGPDWAPYRYGRWVWEDYYGWTWVDYDPWGWAPFHYGRWFWGAGYGWCWYPGPIGVRPFWSPALVGFFGFGGFHVGVGFGGGFGWVPLAPFEAFHPWWGRGYYGGFGNRTVLVNNINVVNNVNIVNTYRNASVANGVTAVNANDFARGRVTPVRVNPAQLRQASLVKGPVPIAPTSSSQRFSDRPVTSQVHSAALNNGRFFSRNQQQGAAQINRQGSTAAGARASSNSGAWRRFGSQPAIAQRANSAPSSGGWSRFGSPTTARSGAPIGNTGGGWRTAGDRPPTAAVQQRYQSAPSDGWRRFQPATAPRSASSYNSNRSVQIASPIVRERSSASYGGGGYSGGTRSAPTHQPAPSGGGGSSHGGGGGGGGHSSGGGGGHSNGGGGHSSHH